MTHDEAQLACSKKRDGHLSPAEQADLQAHLRSCAECRDFAQGMEDSLGAVGAAPSIAMPAAMRERVLRRFDEVHPPASAFDGRIALAAAVILAVVVFLALRRRPVAVVEPAPVPQTPSDAPATPGLPRSQARPEGLPRRGANPFSGPVGRLRTAELAFHALRPPGPVPKGEGGSAGTDDSSQALQALSRALKGRGLSILADDPDFLALMKRRIERRERIAQLKQDGLVGESREGLLGLPPGAPRLSVEHEALVARENDDRDRLISLYAKSPGPSAPPQPQREGAFRHGMARILDTVSRPGEWRQTEGGWSRKKAAAPTHPGPQGPESPLGRGAAAGEKHD